MIPFHKVIDWVQGARIPLLILPFLVGFYAVVTRLMGVGQLYHQDEHRWAIAVNGSYGVWDAIPHPIFSKLIYMGIGAITGYDYLRVVPLILSLLTLTLIMVVAQRAYGTLTSLIAGLLYATTTYALIGSLQIDIDGAFLPFFTILSIGAYLEWQRATAKKTTYGALGVLLLAIVLGLMTKLSFVLVPAAIGVDALLRYQKVRDVLMSVRIMLPLVLFGVLGAFFVWTYWGDTRAFSYIEHFVAFSGRDYTQVLFQLAKVLFYTSLFIPLLIVLGLQHVRQLSVWYLFLAANILFYFVIFDFTHRTFDRYLMFIIVPGVIIAAYVLSRVYAAMTNKARQVMVYSFCIVGVIATSITHIVFSSAHTLLALTPKSKFIEALKTFEWNILFPLSGGSGPIGFYLPLDGMLYLVLASFFFGVLFILDHLIKKQGSVAPLLLGAFIATTAVHNGFVTFEYLTGGYYGNTTKVATTILSALPDGTKEVRTYNDIAAYELYERGVYAGRFYPHEAFFEANEKRLKAYIGLYMIVDMPHLNPDQLFGRFFSACSVVATTSDKYIEGKLVFCDERARRMFENN